jgi:hypothetical protein
MCDVIVKGGRGCEDEFKLLGEVVFGRWLVVELSSW